MRRQYAEKQIARKVADTLRWAAIKNGEVTYTAKEIANTVYAINALNTERRHASDVQVATNYINAIAAKNMEVGDADVRNILADAYKGKISESDALSLGQFAIDEEVEF